MINLTKHLQSLLNVSPESILNIFNGITEKLVIPIDNELLELLKTNFISSLKGILSTLINSTSTLIQWLIHFLSYIPSAAIALICIIISTYFFTKKIISVNAHSYLKNIFPNRKEKIVSILLEIKKTLINYVLAYILIILISTSITFVGFSLLNINYSLFLSILAGILDLLPIVGIAIVYIPLAIFYFLSGNYFLAISLIILYGAISIIRQIIEPKIMSFSLGIHPIASLAAMFVGLQIQGFIGIIFCLFLIVSYNILKKVNVL